MTTGDKIRKFRMEKRLTQKELGEKCNPPMSDSHIRKYELGKLNPKIQNLQRIADALELDNVNELIGTTATSDSKHPATRVGKRQKQRRNEEEIVIDLLKIIYGNAEKKRGKNVDYYYEIGTGENKLYLDIQGFQNINQAVVGTVKSILPPLVDGLKNPKTLKEENM